MSPDEIHILNLADFTNQKGRLYYYQGNFFHPLDLAGPAPGIIRGAIARFLKANKALVEADRADPNYKTLPQLGELQPEQV